MPALHDDNLVVIMVEPQRISEIFRAVGPLYRETAQRVAGDEHIHGVSTGVRAVLEQLHVGGPLTVPAIARHIGTSRQYVQRMTDEALAAGLVRVAPNPSHRRSSLVTPTRRGAAVIRRILEREQAMVADVARDLSETDVDACLHVLQRLRTAIATPPGA